MLKEIEHEDGPLLTVGEVAEFFERHPDTIRRWSAKCGIPTNQVELGELGYAVWCYTQSDLRTLANFSKDINPKGGRPKNTERR